jgi:3',5'-cyclic AMP phosphodiesterase CpdA
VHTIVQLSDLHMNLEQGGKQRHIFDALVTVLAERFTKAKKCADLLLITGDVFDSALLPIGVATREFADLHARVVAAIGADVPTVIIPGNHDRRRRGFIGPHDNRIFAALREVMGARAFVHGGDIPFLASVVPRRYHGLPLSLIAYDSTYLPRGLLSAGGVIRQEDLLRAAAQIEGDSREEPVLFLLHHHLVPTPLTDLGAIDLGSSKSLLRWGVKKLLPALISNADREELTMTALGAGTAISTLHELGRAVLVLHGHKHYATARMLRGMIQTQGDVLIVSAGSCGMAESWTPAASRDSAKLWPSFNIIDNHDGDLRVDTVSFGYKGYSAGRSAQRCLVHARQRGAAWDVSPVPLEQTKAIGPSLRKNYRLCRVTPSVRNRERYDFDCVRVVEPTEASPRRYVEVIDGMLCAVLSVGDEQRRTPARIELGFVGETRYRVEGGLCRTLSESVLVHGESDSPYEWLGIMNRYACDDVQLTIEGLQPVAEHAFASTTDLGTGIEQPLPLKRTDGVLVASVAACPARTLLRVYFPLV